MQNDPEISSRKQGNDQRFVRSCESERHFEEVSLGELGKLCIKITFAADILSQMGNYPTVEI